jgi:hypothetical protein
MILTRLDRPPAELESRTGWSIKPEGACRAGVCVPLGTPFDVRNLAERLRMALVYDEKHRLWALGPESSGHALQSAKLPEITLPDRNGVPLSLSSLRGTKVFMIAWASW